MNPTFGIDLGTTNSVISWLVDGVPTAIPIEGDPIVPSVVTIHGDRVVVGRQARNLELEHPERTVRSVKRRMGCAEPIAVGSKTVQPEEVSAEILRALKRGAEQVTSSEVRDVVITVPAYFDDAQRRATLKAGELAGLNVLRLLNEPTSASLVYDHTGAGSKATCEYVMVYDLGGGTFDVSVMEIAGDIREVRATAGNTCLGGDDFDELLVRAFVDELKRQGVSVSGEPRAMAKLRRLAEETKIGLSNSLEVTAASEFLTELNGQPVNFRLTVTRRQFEEMLAPLLDNTIELCRRALADAKLTPEELSRVCLVGGSTRIPRVRELLEETLGVAVHEEVDVDLAVGQGASIQAGLLSGEKVGRILVDVTAHSLGVKVIGAFDDDEGVDSFSPIIHRNTALPTQRVKEYYTICDDQNRVKVEVYQGEAPRCSQNVAIGSFDYPLKKAPAHTAVAVSFEYDSNGVVRVTARQAGGEAKSVALSVSQRSAAKTGAGAESPLLRRVDALMAKGGLSAQALEELARHRSELNSADEAVRTLAEERLLDALLDHEG